MPFIGTRGIYRHQGMCHRLLNAIELNTWTTVFGFKTVGPMKKQKLKSVNLLIIHGTGLLEKRLLLTVNAVECDMTDVQKFGEASGSRTPVHASVPGVCEDDMPCKAEDDNMEEVKNAETDANIVAEQKPEKKSNSSYADSSVIPVTVDPCSCSSNELGKGENCPSGELSVEAVLIRDKTESNLNSNSICSRFDIQEDKSSCVVPVNTKVPLVTMGQKPDNHELTTIVADGDTQSSLEVKDLEVIVNERSIDACTVKDQTHGGVTSKAVATTEVRSTERSVQQTDELVQDKTGSPFPDLKCSISKTIMLEKSNETKPIESDKIEMKDATIGRGITVESSSKAGVTVSALDASNDIRGEVTANPTLNCGEGQLRGADGVYNNSMKDGLASGEPVNA